MVTDKTPVEFLLWSADYNEKNPDQKYSMPMIIWTQEITEEDYKKLDDQM